jgi:general secretion pathway protein B
MSYILEALKKAQAERQLGNAPTIHAPQPVQAAPASAAASRKPLLIGVAAGVLVAGAVAVVALRQQAQVEVAAVAPAPATVPAPVAPVSAVPPAPAAQTAPVPVPPARQERSLAKAAPVAPGGQMANPAPVRQARRAAISNESHRGAPAPARAAEDNVRNLNELPEAIQREVPRVVFGGYIYSPNPADRLLLIDKMLRHEGEEVAPGLVLEKLQPKGAVMNYKGYRYRVAY